MDEITEEVRSLVADGVTEFNVIAQDLSSYGTDLYGRHALAELIDRIADIEGVEWIRSTMLIHQTSPWIYLM